MLWQTSRRTFDFSTRGAVMGILNVTPDSFSDGGCWVNADAAVAHGLAMAREGAEIIDVGGESTRPGAEPVAEAVEMERVLPVIERLRAVAGFGAAISIDTMKPGVARAAVAAGAEIVNDVTGLGSAEMREVVRETGAAAVIMHMLGEPRTMQVAPVYADVLSEIRETFRQSFQACLACGIEPMRLAFDPGIGFGKTVEHNLTLLRGIGALRCEDRPLVVGVSRKSFIGKAIGGTDAADREWPTVALTSLLRTRGAEVVRVHDVRPNCDAMRMTEAMMPGGPSR